MSRSIFEEVSETQKPAATPGGVSGGRGRGRALVRAWLMALFALVVVMIAVGGLTRLTDSGLSITEWAPLSGAIPPLSAEAWDAEFEAYRAIPEYKLQNQGMSLAEFKVIYWWEWGHRQLGRVIGLVWSLGFVGLLATRNVPTGWTGRLLLLGGLGGLQGAIGWWMVSSGLEAGMLDVASYRLAIHLGLAFLILALIAWYVMALGRDEAALMQARRSGDKQLKGMATGVLHLTFLQILIGALVAGIDAGRNFIDWPLMAGGFTPPDMWVLEPVWRNLFENDGTVQFFHRIVGYLLFIFGVVVWWMARRSALVATKRAFDWMAVMLLGQMVLGIITVMHSSPWYLAILHQFGAVVLVVLVLRARFLSLYPLPQSVRGAGA
ncbi:heme A synthase [Roseobacter sp. HKCCD9010]|uniref:heme A synthase n=1 Tax=unclassified Roseobacter TaxID=196798 RepID=UPI0014928A01|nr:MULTISPECIES: heme A synthase [unclassified Roseobacter]MBF9050516.1 heme A synthase [Rhodobacterales bacterium HKCCD4356]NNV12067.1 heme A synthase [Roseobacter sp. HKCCD7357]NNV17081.1 heme A synthase [Roseobacter sp. HKCCD8768]NNV26310.1 heme A synthase [Roseobacter sp. HKCCD8192]NNV30805.1 heme A synthase [Roseobacter sp. HKCCD9061]